MVMNIPGAGVSRTFAGMVWKMNDVVVGVCNQVNQEVKST